MKCEAFEYNCLEGHPPCIHTSMICDGAPHCMINDDEKTCGMERCNFYNEISLGLWWREYPSYSSFSALPRLGLP